MVSSRTRPIRAVVASRLFAPEIAAASFRLRSLADALAALGAEVRVLTTRPPASAAATDPPGSVRISRFPVLRDRSGSVRGYLQYLSFDIPLFFRLLFARADIVIAEPPPTTGAVVAVTSWLRRRPFAYYAADVWSDAANSTGAPDAVVRLLRGVESAVLRRAAIVLAVSAAVAERARELSARNVEDVGNGIDATVFTPDGPAADASEPFFVYAGTMSEWQGAEVFIEAMPSVLAIRPTARLHLLGQGSQLAALKSRALEVAPEAITFHGVVPPEETARWLRTATAALVSIAPGRGYDFAKPTKLYAAAACGTPVIFAGDGAGRELVENAGLGTASDHEPDAVAEAMLGEIAAGESGESADRRPERYRWARENASLDAAGMRAARAVLSLSFTRGEERQS